MSLAAGFVHSAFTLNHESSLSGNKLDVDHVPPGALVTFVQKGIQYMEMEANLTDVSMHRSTLHAHNWHIVLVVHARMGHAFTMLSFHASSGESDLHQLQDGTVQEACTQISAEANTILRLENCRGCPYHIARFWFSR